MFRFEEDRFGLSADAPILDAKPARHAAFAPASPPGVSLHTVVDNGPSDNRVDVWFVGDGYTAGQLDLLLADVAAQWDWMTTEAFAEPFGRYADLFNVHVVFAPSAEEGADKPADGLYVETAFGASYSWDGETERLLYLDVSLADAAIETVAGGRDVDMRFGVVNDTAYGGGGGRYAVYAAGAEGTRSVALHEAGHAFARLADEYWTPGDGAYDGLPPDEVNLSTDPDAVPWAHWLGFDDGVLGPIGAYEGGRYAESGIYRPTENSLMRSLDRPFDAVAREQFVLGFYGAVDPLDDWSHRDEIVLTDVYDPFWAETVSDDLVGLAWSVNGAFVGSADALDVVALGLAPGTHEISVTATDDTPLVREGKDALTQTVSWLLELNFFAQDGTEAGEAMTGGADADRLAGLGGDDVLTGGGGADWLIGGAGDDVLYGDGGVG